MTLLSLLIFMLLLTRNTMILEYPVPTPLHPLPNPGADPLRVAASQDVPDLIRGGVAEGR